MNCNHSTRFVFFFLLLFSSNFAQEIFLGRSIHFTPEQRPTINFNENDYYNGLITKYKPIIKKESELNEFASAITESKKYYVYSNTEYENLNIAVAYIEKIIAKLQFEKTLDLRIKIIRDPSLNACAFEDGTIYINIGLLAKYKTEAQIAAILGHEVGHVLKQHAYKSYATHKEYFNNLYYNAYNPNPSLLGTIIKTQKLSSRLIAQEEESDAISTNALIGSNFNSMALSQCFQSFSTLHSRYESSIYADNTNSLLYLRTHPSSEKRQKKASEIINNSGANFLVDSIYFKQLKQQAIDESINLLFESQDFEECIEMAFVEHLKKPNDPYYLFFLTECLRRSIEYDKQYGAFTFITSNYKLDFCNKPITNRIIIAKTNNETIPLNKNAHAILLNLVGPILLTDSSDYRQFTAFNLVSEDTLEFVTNLDAYKYFKQKNTELKFYLNNRFATDLCGETNSIKEKKYCDLPNVIKAYEAEASSKKNLFVLYNVDHFIREQKGIYNNSHFSIIHDTYKNIYDAVKTYNIDKEIVTDSVLNYSEQNHLTDYLKLIYPLIKHKETKPPSLKTAFKMLGGEYSQPEFVTRDTANFKSYIISPELIEILNKHHLDGIIFSSVVIEETKSSNSFVDSDSKTWTVKHYYLDAKKQKIKYYSSPNCIYITSSFGFGSSKYVDLPKCFYESIKDAIK